MAATVGPTSNLPGTTRRQGRGGQAFRDAQHLGEVIAVDWDVEAEQVDVLIGGTWRTEQIPGAETRRGTMRMQDVDDRWKYEVWSFFEERRQGNFSAQVPVFNLVTKLQGGAVETLWQLTGCQLFGYSGGYSNEDDLLSRELAFSFQSDRPTKAFAYGAGGIVVYEP